MDIYRQQILDHYHNPRNTGQLKDADCQVSGDNPLCGDSVSVTVKLSGDLIKQIKFEAEGCAVSVAAMSMLSERIIDQKISDVLAMRDKDIQKMVGVKISPTRMKCARLGLQVVKQCLKNFK